MFEGVSVAMATPLRGGSLDESALERMLEHLLHGGVAGIVPAGTTGEGATLRPEERRVLISRTVAAARGRAFVVPGTGSNDTRQTIEMTQEAKELGADGALVVTPYYNKPTQEGLLAHFRAVADSVALPLMLYNVPSRTAVSLTPGTIRQLADHPNIVAIKEACGSLDQVSQIVRDTDLTVLSGDDPLTLPMLAVGARGVVSVVGNAVPGVLVRMVEAFESGDTLTARQLHLALTELGRVLFLETNPAPVKRALATMGLMQEELRLPLVPVRPETARAVDEACRALSAGLARGHGAARS